ncbi:MAG TPA: hypothetical protein DIU15_18135 [Deltaproteobacteria bacterium]|nr:hypothetical protein [Deltaproteobacteria bacterium]HCP47965.1 hypothetical protein [Deltaproteobacteria bacterium]
MKTLLATSLALLLATLTMGCDTTDCADAVGEPAIEVGFSSVDEWQPVSAGDAIFVEAGNQGSGLMVLLNLRLVGVDAAVGAYSTLDVQLVRDGEALTVEGGRTMAAVCQDDGALVARNRRVEFTDLYYTLDDLDGIYDGFEGELQVTAELIDGTQLQTVVPVVLEAG